MSTSHKDENGTSGKQVHTLDKVGAHDTAAEDQEHPHGHAAIAPTHGHPAGSGDHIPHVLPLKIYIATWIALLVFTAITVAASYVDVGSANILIALLIATIKATIVAMMFMHLRYDHRFHAIIFSFSVIFLAIFIAFTMYDTETRGRTDQIQADRSLNVKAPFKNGVVEGKNEILLKERYGVPANAPLPQQNLTPPQN
jgi:cytochrome c oxidase subunit 4